MNKQTSTVAVAAQAEAVRSVEVAGKMPESVKDAGRVRIGAGLLRFIANRTLDATKDSGRVRVGAGLLRF